jgi:hypothetical protein
MVVKMNLTNKDIDEFVFDDPEIDNIKPFNYSLRSKLIKREIRREDYLFAEEVLLFIRKSKKAMRAFVEAFQE